MGVFLAEPITKALNEALTARAALSELRRVLEIIVPLAYRPPIKVNRNIMSLGHITLLSIVAQIAVHCTAGLVHQPTKCMHMLARTICAVVSPPLCGSQAQRQYKSVSSLTCHAVVTGTLDQDTVTAIMPSFSHAICTSATSAAV